MLEPTVVENPKTSHAGTPFGSIVGSGGPPVVSGGVTLESEKSSLLQPRLVERFSVSEEEFWGGPPYDLRLASKKATPSTCIDSLMIFEARENGPVGSDESASFEDGSWQVC